MPDDLEQRLQEAADSGASRTKPADFDTVVRRARRRRRNVSMVGAAGLVACVAIGVAVVAGLRTGAAPDPQSGTAAAGPGTTGVEAKPSTGPKRLEPKVLPINLTEAQKDQVLRPLITDIGVIAWKPEAGRTADQVRESAGYAAFLNGNDIRPERQPLLNDIGNLTLTFPHADSDDPAVFTADPLTELDLQQAADLLSQVPGVDEARVVKLRGMWFRAQVTTEGPPGREADGMGPVISLPGIQGGAALTEPGSAGKTRYTPYVVYVGGGVDRNALDRIKTSLAEHWGAAAGDVVLTPQKIDPE